MLRGLVSTGRVGGGYGRDLPSMRVRGSTTTNRKPWSSGPHLRRRLFGQDEQAAVSGAMDKALE